MHEDGCVMPRHPTHGVEASSSRAALAAPDGAAARPEQELWKEFRKSRRLAQQHAERGAEDSRGSRVVGVLGMQFLLGLGVFSLPSFSRHFCACASSNSASHLPCPLVTGVGGPTSGEARPPRSTDFRA
jgi:hypothetical protein